MEAATGNERTVAKNFENNVATHNSGSSGSEGGKNVTDPVVYKLVRVDFDGRFVPATDDELMQVEGFLDYGKGELLSVSDVVQAVECSSVENDLSEKQISQPTEGSNSKYTELDAKTLNMQFQETFCTSTSGLDGRRDDHSGTKADCSNPEKRGKELRSSTSASVGAKPDFSRLKGEINLDNLTIRELQETFQATFGRETSSKDKQWLKRRIAMGLTNSCDVSVASFIIKDNKLVKKVDHILPQTEDSLDLVGRVTGDTDCDLPLECQNDSQDIATGLKLDSSVEYAHKNDNLLEQRSDKRVRKPTKRYIEELSDLELKDCPVRPVSSVKQSEGIKDLLKPAAAPVPNVKSDIGFMRPDSAARSGVHAPNVSRIRSCRPRKIVKTLSSFGLSRKLSPDVGKVHGSPHAEKKVPARSIPFEELLAEEKSKEKQKEIFVPAAAQNVQERDAKPMDSSSGNSSDDTENAPASFTAKGGMRRKHHRAWTLTEVVKLVDGVSKYGAGRWSEIKKLSFASYSHRTSVDLKDKWRNLLKASFSGSPQEKGTMSRKNNAAPIPLPILLKVRELAEINGQVPRNFGASSVDKASGNSVNENRSGFI